MFQYTHEVLEEGTNRSWGIFPSEGIARILAGELNRKFRVDNTSPLFIVRLIK